MAVTMTDTEQVVLTAVENDGGGNVVTPEGQLSWTADSAVVTLQVSDDTLSCTVVAASVGTANVTVTDSGAGLTSVPEEITVTAGAATSISITASDPSAVTPAS